MKANIELVFKRQVVECKESIKCHSCTDIPEKLIVIKTISQNCLCLCTPCYEKIGILYKSFMKG